MLHIWSHGVAGVTHVRDGLTVEGIQARQEFILVILLVLDGETYVKSAL